MVSTLRASPPVHLRCTACLSCRLWRLFVPVGCYFISNDITRTGAVSTTTRRRSAQPQLAPTAARKAGAHRRKASTQNRRPQTALGHAIPAGASREGPVSDYKGQHARGSTCQEWLRRRMVLDRTRAWGGNEPTSGFCLCGRTEAVRRVLPGKVGTRPGCRVLPAAGRSHRSGARRELTRARRGVRQARVLMAFVTTLRLHRHSRRPLYVLVVRTSRGEVVRPLEP